MIGSTFCTDIHGPPMMYPNDLILSEMSQQLLIAKLGL